MGLLQTFSFPTLYFKDCKYWRKVSLTYIQYFITSHWEPDRSDTLDVVFGHCEEASLLRALLPYHLYDPSREMQTKLSCSWNFIIMHIIRNVRCCQYRPVFHDPDLNSYQISTWRIKSLNWCGCYWVSKTGEEVEHLLWFIDPEKRAYYQRREL